jgi:plastocyanin
MKLRQILAAAVAGALWLSSGGAVAASDMTSVTIVEPRVQSRWGYAPTTVNVQAGTWVTWSNAGLDAHTVTAIDGSFDSGNLDPSDGFSWFFADPGTYEYICTLHSWMTGSVIVSDQLSAVSLQPEPPDQVTPEDPNPPSN